VVYTLFPLCFALSSVEKLVNVARVLLRAAFLRCWASCCHDVPFAQQLFFSKTTPDTPTAVSAVCVCVMFPLDRTAMELGFHYRLCPIRGSTVCCCANDSV
jgi:hypothetical protein